MNARYAPSIRLTSHHQLYRDYDYNTCNLYCVWFGVVWCGVVAVQVPNRADQSSINVHVIGTG